MILDILNNLQSISDLHFSLNYKGSLTLSRRILGFYRPIGKLKSHHTEPSQPLQVYLPNTATLNLRVEGNQQHQATRELPALKLRAGTCKGTEVVIFGKWAHGSAA